MPPSTGGEIELAAPDVDVHKASIAESGTRRRGVTGDGCEKVAMASIVDGGDVFGDGDIGEAAEDLAASRLSATRTQASALTSWPTCSCADDGRLRLQRYPRGAVIAASSCLPFAGTGWVGGVEVHPMHRRKGLGEKLTRVAVEALHAAGDETVLLHATPMAVELYARMGFDAKPISSNSSAHPPLKCRQESGSGALVGMTSPQCCSWTVRRPARIAAICCVRFGAAPV